MKQITSTEFLDWAAARGIVPDARYAEPRSLVYGTSRFWTLPEPSCRIPAFIAHMFAGIAQALPCYLWPRGGRWISRHRVNPPPHASDRVLGVIADGAGVPIGFEGAFRASDAEFDAVLTIAFSFAMFGASVRDDVFIIPEHARCIIGVSHHDVISASFGDTTDLDRFITHMSAKGYELPDEPPDGTFKPQPWMKGTQSSD